MACQVGYTVGMYVADDQPADNTLRELPDGVIELVQTGHQTKTSSMKYQVAINELVADRRKKKQKALILVDLSGVTGHDADVRQASIDALKNDFDGLAIFGENATIRMLVNWLIRSAGQGDRVHFFDTREAALEWLHKR
jgi:ribosome-associated protein YbcJ (S4-like RNA binding protein)